MSREEVKTIRGAKKATSKYIVYRIEQHGIGTLGNQCCNEIQKAYKSGYTDAIMEERERIVEVLKEEKFKAGLLTSVAAERWNAAIEQAIKIVNDE